MSVYGVELLEDNVVECRGNLISIFSEYLGLKPKEELSVAAMRVLELNIVHGDALTMSTRGLEQEPITFAEWAYVGKGMYQRRDFRLETLTQMSSFTQEGSLFAELGRHEIFTPMRDYGSLSVADIAKVNAGD